MEADLTINLCEKNTLGIESLSWSPFYHTWYVVDCGIFVLLFHNFDAPIVNLP